MKKNRNIKWIEKIIYLITRFVLFMGVYIVIFFLFSKHDEIINISEFEFPNLKICLVYLYDIIFGEKVAKSLIGENTSDIENDDESKLIQKKENKCL